MKRIVRGVCGLLSAVMLLSATAMAAAVETNGTRVKGFYNSDDTSLQMELTGRYDSGEMSEDGGSLEIVQYNARNGFAYAVSGVKGVLIAIDLNENMSGSTVADLNAAGKKYDLKDIVKADGFTYGDMTSVAVSPDGKTLAVAIQAEGYTENGVVAIFTCKKDGTLKLDETVSVGVQPDMVTFTPDGSKILTANEGEPRMGYSADGAVDPEGSVSIIDVKAFAVKTVGFDAFDIDRYALVKEGIVLKKSTNPSVDLEPEYIACTDDTAYVTCQEANAIAVLDLSSEKFTGIYSVGFEDYSKVKIDIDKKDEKYAPKAYESLRGIRMPDGISLYEAGGETYLITANEGDAREWGEKQDKYENEKKDKKSL